MIFRVLLLIFLAISIGNAQAKSIQDKTYGVIIDCGSSGSRVNIFEWDSSLNSTELLNNIAPLRNEARQLVSKKIKPGLSDLGLDPKSVAKYIEPLIDFILKNLPKDSQTKTGIYILATAGMRLLNDQAQKAIMNNLVNHLKRHYKFAKVKASVISGSDEGIYQWISLNSKLKKFKDVKKPSEIETCAVVEMGGASIQITYEYFSSPNPYKIFKEVAPKNRNDFLQLITKPHVGEKSDMFNHQVFSATFLGFGSNSARDIYTDLLIDNSGLVDWMSDKQDNNISSEINDPCLPNGVREKLEKPTKMLAKDRKKTIGFTIKDGGPTFKVNIVGTGQYDLCQGNLRKMLRIAKEERLNCKPDEACAMSFINGDTIVPFGTRYQFIAVGDFFHTANEMLGLAGEFNHFEFVVGTKRICETPYEELKQLYPEANRFDKNRIKMECFKATWMETFLLDGLGFKGANTKENKGMLQTVDKIDGDSLDWTLGAIIDKSLTIQKNRSNGQPKRKKLERLIGGMWRNGVKMTLQKNKTYLTKI